MVDTERFDWDDANIDHIALHGIEPDDTEEAIRDPKRVRTRAQPGVETRSAVIGSTESGRILFVVYTYRGRKTRVVTAREAGQWQRRKYEERGK